MSQPAGDTGAIIRRSTSGAGGNDLSLDAPSAGSAQSLTINATGGSLNASGVAYRIVVSGSST